MRITSTNIGERKKVMYRGKPVFTGIFKSPQKQPIFLGKEDVEKDAVIDRKYHGGIDKACYCYSKEAYAFWQPLFPELRFEYGMFGENLTIEGLKEEAIHLGDVWTIGEAKVQVTQPRQPCFKLGIRFNNQGVLNQFIKAPYPGVYLKVLKEGLVRVGDEVSIEETSEKNPRLLDVYQLLYSLEPKEELIRDILSFRDLPEPLRETFAQKLKKLV